MEVYSMRKQKKTPTYKMEDLQTIDEIIDFPHEAFHEDHLRQADAHVLEFGREGLHLREIMQLHGGREIEQHVRQVRTLVRQLVEDSVRDQLDRQLDVPQRRAEACAVPDKTISSHLNTFHSLSKRVRSGNIREPGSHFSKFILYRQCLQTILASGIESETYFGNQRYLPKF